MSDLEIDETCLKACATSVQWLLGQLSIENGTLTIAGWAIARGNPSDARFLINGEPFKHVNYPINRTDVADYFCNLPNSADSGFFCHTDIERTSVFSDGFVCLQFLDSEAAVLPDSRQKAWYFADPQYALPMPDSTRIQRINGSADLVQFVLGGASTFKRLEHYLAEKLRCSFTDFPRILDWGCGCGRVARYFHSVRGVQLYGGDIDGDNVSWCAENLPHGVFSRLPLSPPTSFQDDFFDLVLGFSVLTHLSETNQFLWLEELKRITRRGALVMLSFEGPAMRGLGRLPRSIVRDIEEKGFFVTGRNEQLDTVLDDTNYYINVIHSYDYIHKNWGKYFTILDIVDAIAANQALVVMRNDT